MLIGTAIIAGLSGYMIGIASSLGFFPIPFMPKPAKERGIANYDDEEESEEEDIDASILDHAPNWANGLEADRRDGLRVMERSAPKKDEKKDEKKNGKEKSDGGLVDNGEECKLVLIVRTDLGMTKGMQFNTFEFLCTLFQYLTNSPHRKNCRTMFSRNPCLLQSHLPPRPQFMDPPPLGTRGSSQGCATSKIGR